MEKFYSRIISIIIVLISVFLILCGTEDMWTRLHESGVKLHVTYYSNGGTGDVPVDTAEYISGDEAVVYGNINGMTNGALQFNGWTITVDGTGEVYTQGEIYTIGAENVSLYARWISGTTCTVTYNPNTATGGTVPVDTTKYVASVDTAIVLENTGGLYKTGYTFSGWNTLSGGNGTNYAPGAAIPITANITLYAKWNLPVMVSQDYTPGGVDIDTTMFSFTANVSVLSNSVNIPDTGSINSRYFRIPAIIEGAATICSDSSGESNSFSVIRVPLPPAINKKNLPSGFYFISDSDFSNIITDVELVNEDGSTSSFPAETVSYPRDTEYTFRIELYNTYQEFFINGALVRHTDYPLKSTVWWTFQVTGNSNESVHLLDSISISAIQQSDSNPVIP